MCVRVERRTRLMGPSMTPHLPVQTRIEPEFIHGAHEIENTPDGLRLHRLPAWARAQARDAQLSMVEAQPAGVRIAFETTSTSLELRASATRYVYTGLPARPRGIFDLVVDGAVVASTSLETATVISIDLSTGAMTTTPGGASAVRFDGLREGMKTVGIWLPHNETVEVAELHSDAPLRPIAVKGMRWLHHGSSISQGSNAMRPTETWPAVAALSARLNLVNLGFGGSALLDSFTARTIRETPADAISVKLGINVVNTDLMRVRAFRPAVHGFLDTIRDGHPDTPLLVISPLHCAIHEDTPGPGAFDLDAMARGETRFRATGDPAEVGSGKLTLTVIRDQLADIVAERSRSDAKLRYLDGRELYGPDDERDLPLPDGLHPDATAHRLIGERFVRTGVPLLTHGPIAR